MHSRAHIKATVLLPTAERVVLSLLCQSRAEADKVIEALYPDHLYAACIVKTTR
jgi:hypothetical protein